MAARNRMRAVLPAWKISVIAFRMHAISFSRWRPVFAVLLVWISLSARAERVTSDSMERIGARLEEFFDANKGAHDPKHAIVAFDLDDTLMSTRQVLGSETWFTWQEQLLAQTDPEKKKGLVAKNFTELLDIQGRILGLIRFEPTEKSTVGVVKRLQDLGVDVILCTSRGATDYTATYRELKRAGVDLSGARIAKAFRNKSRFLPFTLEAPEDGGLTKDELAAWGIKKDPTPVVFQSGLLMTEGQHKGAMLRALLHRSRRKYTSVSFVDNRKKHVERVEAAFPKTDGLTIFYTKVNPENPSFQEDSPAPNPFEDWKRLEPLLR